MRSVRVVGYVRENGSHEPEAPQVSRPLIPILVVNGQCEPTPLMDLDPSLTAIPPPTPSHSAQKVDYVAAVRRCPDLPICVQVSLNAQLPLS